MQFVKDLILDWSKNTIFSPSVTALTDNQWEQVIEIFKVDYQKYYTDDFKLEKIKYFPGLLATFFYRISRRLFLLDDSSNAQEYASLGFFLSSTEIYYSAKIGTGLKINHSVGTIIGARVIVGNNVLLHHNVTLGDKNGGRPIIEDEVIVYPGATIVGEIVIGRGSIIGANVFVDKTCSAKSIIL